LADRLYSMRRPARRDRPGLGFPRERLGRLRYWRTGRRAE
jgi:hypothetical protein